VGDRPNCDASDQDGRGDSESKAEDGGLCGCRDTKSEADATRTTAASESAFDGVAASVYESTEETHICISSRDDSDVVRFEKLTYQRGYDTNQSFGWSMRPKAVNVGACSH
jgi:hypothetical protein